MKPANLSTTAKNMLTAIVWLFAGLLAAGLAVTLLLYRFEPPLAYALGLALGCASSALKVVLLERSNAKLLELDSKAAENLSRLFFVLRFTLTVILLLPVVLLPDYVGLFGAILGVLSLQAAAHIAGRRQEKQA